MQNIERMLTKKKLTYGGLSTKESTKGSIECRNLWL